MDFKAIDIAQLLGGKVEGDENTSINTLESIETSNGQAIAFLSNLAYEKFLYTTGAGIVIINKSLVLKKPISNTIIRVDDAYVAYAKLLSEVEKISRKIKSGVESPSYIDKTASIGKNVYIGACSYIGKNATIADNVQIYPNCYIGENSVIQEDTLLYSGAKVYHNITIGKRCVIQSNAVIGSDGFGFAPSKEGKYFKIPHVGTVHIEDDVEVGACTCIDRSTTGVTRISKGSKLDNQIHIAHNVYIGENTVMAAQIGISGSTKIGNQCKIGGKAGIAGHLDIKDGVQIGANSGVMKDIEENEIVLGSPAWEVKSFMRSIIGLKKLPNLIKQVRELEEKVLSLFQKN